MLREEAWHFFPLPAAPRGSGERVLAGRVRGGRQHTKISQNAVFQRLLRVYLGAFSARCCPCCSAADGECRKHGQIKGVFVMNQALVLVYSFWLFSKVCG